MEYILIGVVGGTGYGKSTFTNKIKDGFVYNVYAIYHNNYYKYRDGILFEVRKKTR